MNHISIDHAFMSVTSDCCRITFALAKLCLGSLLKLFSSFPFFFFFSKILIISGYIAYYLHKCADLVLLSSLKQLNKIFSFSSRVIVLDLAKIEFLIFSPHRAEKQSDSVWVGTWCTARVTPSQS